MGRRQVSRAGFSAAQSRTPGMRHTYDWLKSWGMLEDTASPLELVDIDLQSQAHPAAE